MVYLYLWTEFINANIRAYPYQFDPPSTNITVIKYKITKENTDLAAVNFNFKVKEDKFPNNFSKQITNQSKQMKDFSHFGILWPTGLPENSIVGESKNKDPQIIFDKSSVNIETSTVTIATADDGVKSEDNNILAYVHGVHFDILRINSATNSSAESYIGKEINEIGKYLVVGNPDSVSGCTDSTADNYNQNADKDDGSCIISGCNNESADNFNRSANKDDGSCIISGCTDPTADNYNENANNNDRSCIYKIDCSNRLKGDFNNDGQVNVADLVFLQKYLNNDKNTIDIVNNDECFSEIGDLNGDGQINVADLVFLQKYLNNDPNFKI